MNQSNQSNPLTLEPMNLELMHLEPGTP
jgi:hypothetical protein